MFASLPARRNVISKYKFNQAYFDTQVVVTPPEYAWDEEGLASCLKINPTERISICNDPYTDERISRERTVQTNLSPLLESFSNTDESEEEEEDIETDYDNDSIRQLEWDCLENSLTYMIEGGELYSPTHYGGGNQNVVKSEEMKLFYNQVL